MKEFIPSGMTRADMRIKPIHIPKFDHSRFLSKIRVLENNCWKMDLKIRKDGYFNFGINGRTYLAHRVSHEIFSGFEYSNTLIDHICMNRYCVNPEHLREVDPRTNALENSNSPKKKQFEKTHCKHGHEFTPENTYIIRRGVYGGILRNCRECEKNRVYRRKLQRWAKKNG